ncbi:hypothetical protein HDU96_007067 [Phlyctochytrium bullatum]|nr:hypothetical protein HDU96_007067 [Phlyctochytrium bullatum]
MSSTQVLQGALTVNPASTWLLNQQVSFLLEVPTANLVGVTPAEVLALTVSLAPSATPTAQQVVCADTYNVGTAAVCTNRLFGTAANTGGNTNGTGAVNTTRNDDPEEEAQTSAAITSTTLARNNTNASRTTTTTVVRSTIIVPARNTSQSGLSNVVPPTNPSISPAIVRSGTTVATGAPGVNVSPTAKDGVVAPTSAQDDDQAAQGGVSSPNEAVGSQLGDSKSSTTVPIPIIVAGSCVGAVLLVVGAAFYGRALSRAKKERFEEVTRRLYSADGFGKQQIGVSKSIASTRTMGSVAPANGFDQGKRGAQGSSSSKAAPSFLQRLGLSGRKNSAHDEMLTLRFPTPQRQSDASVVSSNNSNVSGETGDTRPSLQKRGLHSDPGVTQYEDIPAYESAGRGGFDYYAAIPPPGSRPVSTYDPYGQTQSRPVSVYDAYGQAGYMGFDPYYAYPAQTPYAPVPAMGMYQAPAAAPYFPATAPAPGATYWFDHGVPVSAPNSSYRASLVAPHLPVPPTTAVYPSASTDVAAPNPVVAGSLFPAHLTQIPHPFPNTGAPAPPPSALSSGMMVMPSRGTPTPPPPNHPPPPDVDDPVTEPVLEEDQTEESRKLMGDASR